jgi:tetratricopeptide (TPR) repeat protein
VLIDTETWRPGLQTRAASSGTKVFAPDSRSLASVTDLGRVAFLDMKDGREVARFEAPDQSRAEGPSFSPDGSRMVVTMTGEPVVRVWDLRAIRRQLAALGLDWDLPLDPATADPEPRPVTGPRPGPVRIDRGALDDWLKDDRGMTRELLAQVSDELRADPDSVEAHHQRGHLLANLGRHAEAVADFSSLLKSGESDAEDRDGHAHLLEARGASYAALGKHDLALADFEASVRLEPGASPARGKLARSLNNSAWMLLNDPAGVRPPGKALALELARQAVVLSEHQVEYLNTLGVALYRLGRLAEAVPVLERSLAASQDRADAFDLFFLAMARHRMGLRREARACYDRAVQWEQAHPSLPSQWVADLVRFEAEARALLDGPPPDLPDEVFAPGPG